MILRSIFLLPLTFAACTQFPDLDGRIDEASLNAPYPTLTPLQPLLARADTTTTIDLEATLQARAAALGARAAQLRAPVIEQRLRQRMLRSIALQQRGV